MSLETLWFALWGVLWAIYFMADGFDFGVGMLYPFLGKTDEEKGTLLRSIGPVWNGNEVWLVAAGGVTFAAFPGMYAAMFSLLYPALLVLLVALILRGAAVEFRGKAETAGGKTVWDAAVFLGSLLPALLFGVAFGHLFRGLPIDGNGYHGSLAGLLHPYGLVTGLLFVLLFLLHGALWVTGKVRGEPGRRAAVAARRIWFGAVACLAFFLLYSALETTLFARFLRNPWWFSLPVLGMIALGAVRFALAGRRILPAFILSGLAIAFPLATGLAGIYPNMLPSLLDPAFSVTVFNAASSPYTLKIMTAVVALFFPIVVLYQAWVYRIFRGPVTEEETEGQGEAY